MTKAETEAKIKALKLQKQNVKGEECEVYSRVVGYLRPVKQWNRGKQNEFKDRVTYKV